MKRLDDYLDGLVRKIPVDQIIVDENNVRGKYNQEALSELTYSIIARGQQKPCLVEKIGPNKYKDVFGNRRTLSSRLAVKLGLIAKEDAYVLTNVCEPLPDSFRLEMQIDENEIMSKRPSYDSAHRIWIGYAPALISRLDHPTEEEIEKIHEAKDYWEIPVDLRKNLSISEYANDRTCNREKVSSGFLYQKLHGMVKKQVENEDNPLSYSAGIELTPLEKKKQLAFLAAIKTKLKKENSDINKKLKAPKKNWSLSRNLIRNYVQEYLERERIEKETGSFLIPHSASRFKSRYLTEMSRELVRATKMVETLNVVESFIENVKDFKSLPHQEISLV